MNDPKPVLILSTGRTGTIFISKLLSALYPQVAAYHESKHSRFIQICTHMHFSDLLAKPSLIKVWKLLKGDDLKKFNCEYFIDANSFLYGLVATAPELYPDLKVVHIIRDPRTYVPSHLNFQLQRPSSFIANRFIPFWQPNPLLTKSLSLQETFSMTEFERFCWIWAYKNSVMNKIQDMEVPYLRIKFEELFSTGNYQTTFRKITEFIGLPTTSNIDSRFMKPVNASTRTRYTHWQSWTPHQCNQLLNHCTGLMKLYNYGNEPEWKLRATSQSINE